MLQFPRAIFVTGTDTGIGKTMVSAALCAGLRASYWKPVQSGLDSETDRQCVRRLSGLPADNFFPESYKLTQPLSPHASAAIDGVTIELEQMRLPTFTQSHLIVEGAGGLMVPLNERHLMIDLIQQLNIPVIVVARSGLGTINHTLLTVEKLREREVEIFGVVMNGEPNPGNRRALEYYGRVQVLAEIPPLGELTSAKVEQAFSYFEAQGEQQNQRSSGSGLSDLAPLHPDENSRTSATSQVS